MTKIGWIKIYQGKTIVSPDFQNFVTVIVDSCGEDRFQITARIPTLADMLRGTLVTRSEVSIEEALSISTPGDIVTINSGFFYYRSLADIRDYALSIHDSRIGYGISWFGAGNGWLPAVSDQMPFAFINPNLTMREACIYQATGKFCERTAGANSFYSPSTSTFSLLGGTEMRKISSVAAPVTLGYVPLTPGVGSAYKGFDMTRVKTFGNSDLGFTFEQVFNGTCSPILYDTRLACPVTLNCQTTCSTSFCPSSLTSRAQTPLSSVNHDAIIAFNESNWIWNGAQGIAQNAACEQFVAGNCWRDPTTFTYNAYSYFGAETSYVTHFLYTNCPGDLDQQMFLPANFMNMDRILLFDPEWLKIYVPYAYPSGVPMIVDYVDAFVKGNPAGVGSKRDTDEYHDATFTGTSVMSLSSVYNVKFQANTVRPVIISATTADGILTVVARSAQNPGTAILSCSNSSCVARSVFLETLPNSYSTSILGSGDVVSTVFLTYQDIQASTGFSYNGNRTVSSPSVSKLWEASANPYDWFTSRAWTSENWWSTTILIVSYSAAAVGTIWLSTKVFSMLRMRYFRRAYKPISKRY
jgi:hypothetical protein